MFYHKKVAISASFEEYNILNLNITVLFRNIYGLLYLYPVYSTVFTLAIMHSFSFIHLGCFTMASSRGHNLRTYLGYIQESISLLE